MLYFGYAQGKENPVAERSRSVGFSGISVLIFCALRLRSGSKKLRPSASLRVSPSTTLRVKKIRSLSGAEAPDFQEECDKFLRPSTPLRASLRLRSGSKKLRPSTSVYHLTITSL